VDIVGTAIGLQHLGIDRVVSSPLPIGRGMVHCQHGLLPLPAPATLELLRGAPVCDAGRDVELVTPTGAAIVTTLARAYGNMPAMTIDRVGYGLGHRRGHAIPNALRAVLGEAATRRKAGEEDEERARANVSATGDARLPGTMPERDTPQASGLAGEAHGSRSIQAPEQAPTGTAFPPEPALVIEASIDDMSPQLFEPLLEKLLEEGALDVVLMPVQMKKGRPAILLQLVCDVSMRDALLATLLRESTTIGARYYPISRARLERRVVPVATPFGSMRVKLSGWEGSIWNVMPEFEDCRRVALEHGLPLKQVQQEVVRCALEQGLGPGGRDG
jgi:hypothetical protein